MVTSARSVKKSKENAIPVLIREAHLAAVEARGLAYAPYSKFQVGAALITSDHQTVLGCNVENASYGGTVCAERVAIWKSVSEGVREFTDIVVVTDAPKPAFPCAFCLQVMAEFFEPETKIWIADLSRIHGVHAFKDLLPQPFGPRQLGDAREAAESASKLAPASTSKKAVAAKKTAARKKS